MPKNKQNNIDTLSFSKAVEAVLAIVTVFGPLDDESVVGFIEHYFPDIYKAHTEDDLYAIIEIISMQEAIHRLEFGELSIHDQEISDTLEQLSALVATSWVEEAKEFKDPQEILQYATPDTIAHPTALEIKEILDTIPVKEDVGLFSICMTGIINMADPEEIIGLMKRKAKKPIDEAALYPLIEDLMAEVPRGFLMGYSFNEFNAMKLGLMESDRLEVEENYKTFGSYTYEQCQELANQLKETDLFSRIDSDVPLEILINGQPTFIQLLGFYNGDRNVIVYGDEENFLYNHEFMISDEGDYPDIHNRIVYSEIVLDDTEGFLTPEIEYQLDKKGLESLPLLIDFNECGDNYVSLPTQEDLDTMGAVLESLLIIANEIDDDVVSELTENLRYYTVAQVYLYEDQYATGFYVLPYVNLGELPFELDYEIDENTISATREIPVNFGFFVERTSEGEAYLSIAYDPEMDYIIDMKIYNEDSIEKLLIDSVDALEKYGVRPNEIYVNNPFAIRVYEALLNVYDTKQMMPLVDGEKVNEIYEHIRDDLMKGTPPEELH